MADRDTPIVADRTVTDKPPYDATDDYIIVPDEDAKPVERMRADRAVTTPLAAGIAIITTILGLIVLAWTVLYITKGRFLKHPFERIVSNATDREVKVAGDFQLYFNPLNVKFYAEGLTVSNPEWARADAPYFFQSDRIDTSLAAFPLLFGTRRLNWVDLLNGRIDLQWDAAHNRNTWTFGDPDKKGEPFELPTIRYARLAGTNLRYRDPQMQLAADIAFRTIEGRGTRIENAIRFSGTGSARRIPFSVDGALLSPNETIGGGENRLALTARGARTVADISGTLPGATEIEGAKLRMDVRGGNLADIFSVAGIAVPDTRTYRIRSAVTKDGSEWRFTGLNGRFGASDIGGRMTVRMGGERLFLGADLATRSLDIVDVGPFIGYNPTTVANKGFVAAASAGSATPRILPDAPLRVEALKNFDAKVNWTVRDVRGQNIPISNIVLGLDLNDRLLKLSPLNFAMARGNVSSDIAINARRNPVFTDYDIRLAPTPMGILLAGWGVEEAGTSGTLKARIKMTGTGNSVRDSLASSNGRIAVIMPKGTFWTRNVQLSELDLGTFIQKMFEDKLKEPIQINCGLIGFSVRNGVAAADPILIDTAKNVMVGRGGFSFRNESLDLTFRADSKKFSLFSAQSPVGINGWFAKPGIDVISPELITRGAAGLGLGVVASPLAAVIAFVDIGDAKAADCGPVLNGATARAQRTTKGQPRDDVGRGTTAKSESGKASKGEERSQRKKFLGIF